MRNENLYKKVFEPIRRQLNKGSIKLSTACNRLTKITDNMLEQDRHYLALYNTYPRISTIALVEEISVKRASNKLSLALNHLTTPNNVAYVIGGKVFKHEGKELVLTNLFTTRTLRALKKSNITTEGDLALWCSLGARFLFCIPGVGKIGVIEILTWYFKVLEENNIK